MNQKIRTIVLFGKSTEQFDNCVSAMNTQNTSFSVKLIDDLVNLSDCDLFLIGNGGSSQQVKQWICAVRNDILWDAKPLFWLTEPSELGLLTDGRFPDDIQQWLAEFDKRDQLLCLNKLINSFEDRLIRYLSLNPMRRLHAEKTLSRSEIYYYPLIELWDDSDGKQVWLSYLIRNKIIMPELLVDRMRQCNHCHGHILNYIDLCPQCHSIDITTQSAIHCFNCGHIGSQNEFTRSQSLTCPNCLTQLRHIGSDYDRPLEEFRCNACSSMFIEGEVHGHCLSCGHMNELNTLTEHKYYNYLLGDYGILKAKIGNISNVTAPIVGDFLSEPQFLWMLDWLNQLTVNQKASHQLMGIHFSNLEAFALNTSEVNISQYMAHFNHLLQGVLKKTDICCQYKLDVLFILLVNIDQSELVALRERIQQLKDSQQEYPLIFQIDTCELPIAQMTREPEIWLDTFYQQLIEKSQ